MNAKIQLSTEEARRRAKERTPEETKENNCQWFKLIPAARLEFQTFKTTHND